MNPDSVSAQVPDIAYGVSESTKASNTEVQTITSRKKTNAQRCREYRERQKLQNTMGQNITAERSDECSETDQLPAKRPKTNAERRKKHYEAQKLKKQQIKKIPKTVKQKNKEYYERKKQKQALNALNHHSDASRDKICKHPEEIRNNAEETQKNNSFHVTNDDMIQDWSYLVTPNISVIMNNIKDLHNTTRGQTDQPSSSKCEAVGMDVDENNSWRPQESDSTKNNQNRFLTVQPISFRCRLCAEDQPYDNLQPKTFNDSSSRICFAVKLKHLGSTFHEFFGDFDNKLLPEFVCDPCNGALEASFKLFLQMENAKLFFSKLSGECEREKNEDPLVSGSYSEIMIKEEPIIDNDSKINIKVEIENDTAINEYDSKISIENHEIKSETSEITIKTEPVDFNDLQIKEEYDSVLNENDTVINEYDNDISIEDHDIKSEASNDSMIEPQEKVERASSSTTKPKPTQTKSKNPKKRAILPANAPAQAHPTTNKRIRKPKIKEHTEETQQEDTSTYQYLHLDLVKLGTTADQIRKHMETVCGRDICSVESLKTPGQYASFKLGIPAKFTDLFLAPATWPGDISIEPWKENY